jgi:hypothetical protein
VCFLQRIVDKKSSSTSFSSSSGGTGNSDKQACCIKDCPRKGSRLLTSLRDEYEVKPNHSGRVCEGHYRQDLRRYKRLHEEGTVNESSSASSSSSVSASSLPSSRKRLSHSAGGSTPSKVTTRRHSTSNTNNNNGESAVEELTKWITSYREKKKVKVETHSSDDDDKPIRARDIAFRERWARMHLFLYGTNISSDEEEEDEDSDNDQPKSKRRKVQHYREEEEENEEEEAEGTSILDLDTSYISGLSRFEQFCTAALQNEQKEIADRPERIVIVTPDATWEHVPTSLSSPSPISTTEISQQLVQ